MFEIFAKIGDWFIKQKEHQVTLLMLFMVVGLSYRAYHFENLQTKQQYERITLDSIRDFRYNRTILLYQTRLDSCQKRQFQIYKDLNDKYEKKYNELHIEYDRLYQTIVKQKMN